MIVMRILTALIFTIPVFNTFGFSSCSELYGCEKKSCEIKRKIEIAKDIENEHMYQGLKIALKEVSRCKDEDVYKEIIDDIHEVKEDLLEYHYDLKEAQDGVDFDKIDKYKEKINEGEEELKSLQIELSKFNVRLP
ncbi:DUF1090 domain-containing protein [Salinivibrio kushneri]|uniref:DUF1090 domain-containing protein n=1 Tax=Salinivibrio kushneri TaxID=1908198 RepID=UPI00098852CF|nr:DUF1090 domain-containing protein [Salinivibrio kushneri]OOE48943.1 hypothetical protein BZG12_16330 [Salinivibrio kushneri]